MSRSDKDAPILATPRRDIVEPRRAHDRNAREAPNCVNASTDKAEPTLEQLLSDRHDPKFMQPNTDIACHMFVFPKLTCPMTAKELPMRAQLRRDIEDPRCVNDSTDKEDPNRAKLRSEREEPN